MDGFLHGLCGVLHDLHGVDDAFREDVSGDGNAIYGEGAERDACGFLQLHFG